MGFHVNSLGKAMVPRIGNRMYRDTAILAFLMTAQIVGAETAILRITVLDENFVAVPNARITVQPQNSSPRRCETGFTGQCQVVNLPPTPAAVHAEKEG